MPAPNENDHVPTNRGERRPGEGGGQLNRDRPDPGESAGASRRDRVRVVLRGACRHRPRCDGDRDHDSAGASVLAAVFKSFMGSA